MLSKRNLLMMLTIIFVVLVIFLSSVILKEYYNDYDVNHAIGADLVEIAELPCSDEDGRVLYLGAEDNGYREPLSEWAAYRKKPFSAFSSLAEGMVAVGAADGEKSCVLLDGTLLRPENEEEIQALTDYVTRGGVLIFYRLPTYGTLKSNDTLQKLLGIQRQRAESVALQEIRIYSGFLLGGETHYSFAATTDPDLADMEREIPWYDISARTKTYMVGFLSDEERSAMQLNNEDMPAILWRSNLGSGSVFAVNGPYMKEGAAPGLLDAMLYEAKPYALYAVVNAQNLSVTGFPVLAEENREKLAEVYGMTAEQFCRDILWPSFVAAAEKGGWKITAFVSAKQREDSDAAPRMDNLIAYLKYFNEKSAEAGVSLGRMNSADLRR